MLPLRECAKPNVKNICILPYFAIWTEWAQICPFKPFRHSPPPLLCALHEVHPELSAQSIVLNEVCLPAGWQQMFTTGHVECAESYHKICCARGHISVVLVVFLNKGIQFESGIKHLHMLSLKDILQWCVHLSFFWKCESILSAVK